MSEVQSGMSNVNSLSHRSQQEVPALGAGRKKTNSRCMILNTTLSRSRYTMRPRLTAMEQPPVTEIKHSTKGGVAAGAMQCNATQARVHTHTHTHAQSQISLSRSLSPSTLITHPSFRHTHIHIYTYWYGVQRHNHIHMKQNIYRNSLAVLHVNSHRKGNKSRPAACEVCRSHSLAYLRVPYRTRRHNGNTASSPLSPCNIAFPNQSETVAHHTHTRTRRTCKDSGWFWCGYTRREREKRKGHQVCALNPFPPVLRGPGVLGLSV